MHYSFRLKNPKEDKESLIYFCSYFNTEKKEFRYSTGEKIKPEEWDFDNKQPNNLTGRTKKAQAQRSVQIQLDRYSSLFTELVNRFKDINEEFTIDIVRQRFDEEFKKVRSRDDFFRIYDLFLEEKKNDYTEDGVSEATLKKYRGNKKILLHFQKETGIKLTLAGFNKKVYNAFLKFCVDVRKHTANTLNRNTGLLKTFLYWALEKKYTYNTDFIKFKKPSKFITFELALSLEQVKKFYEFEFKNERLERVKDLFVLGCTTSLRFGNYSRIKKSDIYEGNLNVRDNKKKTKILSIPLSPMSEEILEKYDYNPPKYSNQKFNEYIKKAFQIAGFTEDTKKSIKRGDRIIEEIIPLYERVVSHTARRTFITIMRNKGVPDDIIIKFTGHADTKMLSTYYRPSKQDKETYMNKVFK